MSYDISLVKFHKNGGIRREIEIGNYTCNVYNMYKASMDISLNSLDGMTALEAIPTLEKGVENMAYNPDKYKAMNPDNGWGDYEGALEYITKLLNECRKHPNYIIKTY